MASLLELVQDSVTPEITRKFSSLVGETPAATDSAVRRAAPAVLAGVVNNASTGGGAERLRALVSEGGWGADVLGSLGARLGGGSSTGTFLSSGARLVSNIFGSKTDGIADLIASGSGVQRGSASTILSLVAPIVMSVIGKQIVARGLSTSGLSTMLAGERSTLLAALPIGMAGLLGMRDTGRPPAGVADPRPDARATAAPIVSERFDPEPETGVPGSGLSRWWPALLVGLAAVAMLFLLTRGRQTDVASMRPEPAASPRQLASVDLPGGGRISVDQGSSVHQLSTYLADSAAGGIPKRFVFDDLHFETGTTRLTPQGQRTVESLAAVLKAYPTVRVTLEGHTDATGDPASNKTLSSQRAGAVKQMLTNAGIAADRLQAEGYGQERPIASNDTETGRARNRRLELVVVAR
jgi:outer membrane protein OmpA-like peptidoglycan-associated protein